MSINKVQLANGETIIDISDSTVTPETLAEGVTAHDASGQKITGKMVPGGGSSVQTDWNQMDETAPDFLKNKPFGEVYGDTVTFNGKTYGVTNVLGKMFKVSDAVPTYDDIAKGGYVVTNEVKYFFTRSDFPKDDVVLPSGVIVLGPIYIIPSDMAGVEDPDMKIIFPESGTYFTYAVDAGHRVTEFQLNGYNGFLNTKQIEKKYIPFTAPMLYMNNSIDTPKYLYTNAECTEKARKGDIPYGGLFLVVLSDSSGSPLAYFYPNSVYTRLLEESQGYDSVIVSNGTDYIILYTAEYTP